MKGPSEKGDQFVVLEYMKGGHVQLFRMVYDRKKGFPAEHL